MFHPDTSYCFSSVHPLTVVMDIYVYIDLHVVYYSSSQDLAGFNHNFDENSEEKEKLDFICSNAINYIKEGGSVLIPIDRLGTILLLLEEMTASLEASDLKVSFLLFRTTLVSLVLQNHKPISF